MSAPLVVNLTDGSVWERRSETRGGVALFAIAGAPKCCPPCVMATYAELEEHGIAGTADALPVPVGPVPQASVGYPPALPWAALLDAEDLADFLDELAASAITNASSDVALAEVETTCGTWRLIAEAQHGHNTAPGPDAATQVLAPVSSLREASSREERHDSPLRQGHRIPHDLEVPPTCRLSPAELDDVTQYWFGGGER